MSIGHNVRLDHHGPAVVICKRFFFSVDSIFFFNPNCGPNTAIAPKDHDITQLEFKSHGDASIPITYKALQFWRSRSKTTI